MTNLQSRSSIVGEGNAAIGFLEGHAQGFRTPAGPDPDVEEPADLVAWDIYFAGARGWIRMEPPGFNETLRPVGWVNAPSVR